MLIILGTYQYLSELEIVVTLQNQTDLPFSKNTHNALGSHTYMLHCDIIQGVTSSDKWINLAIKKKNQEKY